MHENLNAENCDDEKMKIYNAALQKSRLFQNKVQAKKFVKETPKPESKIVYKFTKKARAKLLLHKIQTIKI